MMWMMQRAGKKNRNNKDWQFWQQHNKPLEITGQEMFNEKLRYVHQNLPTGGQAPVQAGFVTKEEDWKYSSARSFCGIEGLVDLIYS